jgi:hypothetical protein
MVDILFQGRIKGKRAPWCFTIKFLNFTVNFKDFVHDKRGLRPHGSALFVRAKFHLLEP